MVVGDDVAAAVHDDTGALRALLVAQRLDGDDRIGHRGRHLSEAALRRLTAVGRERDLGRRECLDDLGGLATHPTADEGDRQRERREHRQGAVGDLPAEQHVAHTELAGGPAYRRRLRPGQRRAGERRGGTRVAPRVRTDIGVVVALVVERCRHRRDDAVASRPRDAGGRTPRQAPGRVGRLRGVNSPWSACLSEPRKDPLKPSGRPNARVDAGSTGGREMGRGARRVVALPSPEPGGWAPSGLSLLGLNSSSSGGADGVGHGQARRPRRSGLHPTGVYGDHVAREARHCWPTRRRAALRTRPRSTSRAGAGSAQACRAARWAP